MPFFKVKLEPVDPPRSGDGQRQNPFQPVQLIDLSRTVTARVWPRIKAVSEADVRRLFKEAQDQGLEHVRGHHITSIESVA